MRRFLLLAAICISVSHADVDVAVSSGSPLEWLNDVPKPQPTGDRTAVGGQGFTQVQLETPRIQSTNVFSYARITTVDLIGEIHWTTREKGTSGTANYPPEVTDDVYYLAMAVFLRKLLHPAQVVDAEAIQYLIYLGEPARAAAEAARVEPTLTDFAGKVIRSIAPVPAAPPEPPRTENIYENMMYRLTWEDLSRAYPFQLNGRFAGRIALLGEEPVPYVIAAADSDHLLLKRNAAVMLGRYDHPKCIAKLRELARHDDAVVRVRAIDALARRKDRETRDILHELLKKEKDKGMRLNYIYALSLIGDEKDLSLVSRELKRAPNDYETIVTCAMAIARLLGKDKSVLKSLRAYESMPIQDPEVDKKYSPSVPDRPNTRRETLTQLLALAFGDTRRVFSWIEEGRKEPDPHLVAQMGFSKGILKKFHAPSMFLLLEVLARSDQGRKYLMEVVRDSNQDVMLRLHAMLKLVIANPPKLSKFLKEFVDPGRPQPLVELALRALAAMNAAEGVEAAKKIVDRYDMMLPQDKKYVVGVAARYLAQRGELGPEKLMMLIERELIAKEREEKAKPKTPTGMGVNEMAFETPAPFLEYLVIELGKVKDPRAVDLLVDVLGSRDLNARAEAVVALAYLGGEKAAEAIVRALEDKDPWIRFMAYRAIKFLSGKDYLCDWYYGSEKERKECVIEYRLWFKGKFGRGIAEEKKKRLVRQDDVELDTLVQQLGGDLETRKRATQALLDRRKKDKGIKAKLLEKLKGDLDPRVRARLEFVVGSVLIDKIWEAEPKGGSMYVSLHEGKLYSASWQNVSCIEPRTGEIIWEHKLSGYAYRTIDVTAGVAFVAVQSTGDNVRCTLEALDAKTGKKLGDLKLDPSSRDVLAADSDHIVFMDASNRLRCFTAKGLREVWKLATPSYGRPTARDGRLYLSSSDGGLQCLDIKTGRQLWVAECEPTYYGVGVTAKMIVTWKQRQKVVAVDAKSGKTVWECNAEGFAYFPPAVSDDHVVYATQNGKLICLEAKSGKKLWDYDRGGGNTFTESGTGFVGPYVLTSSNQQLIALDVATGRKVWEYNTGTYLYGPPAAQGTTFFVPDSDKLAAFQIFD